MTPEDVAETLSLAMIALVGALAPTNDKFDATLLEVADTLGSTVEAMKPSPVRAALTALKDRLAPA